MPVGSIVGQACISPVPHDGDEAVATHYVTATSAVEAYLLPSAAAATLQAEAPELHAALLRALSLSKTLARCCGRMLAHVASREVVTAAMRALKPLTGRQKSTLAPASHRQLTTEAFPCALATIGAFHPLVMPASAFARSSMSVCTTCRRTRAHHGQRKPSQSLWP